MGMYKSIYETISGKILLVVIQLSIMAVYARLFSPEDFGLLAIIQVIYVFFDVFSLNIFVPALIGRKEGGLEDLNGIHSFSMMLGIFLGVTFLVVSCLFVEWFYKIDLFYLSFIFSLAVAINFFRAVPVSCLIIDLRFKIIALIDVFSEVFSFILVLFFYKNGYGLYSLAMRFFFVALFKYIASRLVSLSFSGGRISPGISLLAIRKIFSFSKYQLAFDFVNYFSRNSDNLLIGKYLDVYSLGVYERAYKLMLYPLQVTTMAISPVIQVSVKDYSSRPYHFHIVNKKLSNRLLLMGYFLAFIVYFFSDFIVFFVLGKQWVNVSQLLQVMSFLIPVQAVLSSSGAFFQASGKPELLFFSGLIAAFFNVTAIVVGVLSNSLQTLVLLLLISLVVSFFFSYFLLYRFIFKASYLDFYLDIGRRSIFLSFLWFLVDRLGLIFPASFQVFFMFFGLIIYALIFLSYELRCLSLRAKIRAEESRIFNFFNSQLK